MDFSFTQQEEAFREEVRKFLAEHNPNRPGQRAEGTQVGESEEAYASRTKLMAWNQALYERRWIGFSCPGSACRRSA